MISPHPKFAQYILHWVYIAYKESKNLMWVWVCTPDPFTVDLSRMN